MLSCVFSYKIAARANERPTNYDVEGDQPRRGEAGLRATTAPLGRGAGSGMGIAIWAASEELREASATLAGLHFVAFACLFLQQATGILAVGS
jgi:hypothetical protein